MPLQPLGDSILLEHLPHDGGRSEDVLLSASAREASQEARVVATGPGRMTDQGVRLPLEIRAGDRVLIRRFAGIEVEVEGRELLLVRESEILGRIS